ncbi:MULTISPECIES: hypothetical protein [unclassified Streptomyces]|uniref:hypothetical protein n=1 Tax=unclassified Streptomyces TaxID=2593676 RepID=UPI0013A6DEBE|nr:MULTISPECIES: hypothetical protein [unclassified Streptomyces]
MMPWGPSETMPVGRSVDGQLHFAAQDVTGMLRDIASSITLHPGDGVLTWTREGEEPIALDPATTRTVARILTAQADQMDIQLITIAGQPGP